MHSMANCVVTGIDCRKEVVEWFSKPIPMGGGDKKAVSMTLETLTPEPVLISMNTDVTIEM